MTRCAIYARKSTAAKGDPEAKSVPTQIANAKAFAESRGWSVSDEHVYQDDAVGGAETKKLIGRQRLLDVIEKGAPFETLILRDTSRFSRRDGDEAIAELKAITKRGVAVWFYAAGQQFTYGTLAETSSASSMRNSRPTIADRLPRGPEARWSARCRWDTWSAVCVTAIRTSS
jgi:DNA invertase Pin-like site-specific DNA recombinase